MTVAIKVVDAAALAALLFGEPEAEAIAERLANAQLGGAGHFGRADARFDHVEGRLEQTERSIEGRLMRIERPLDGMPLVVSR